MASEWVMYLSVISLGVLLIAGVTLTFNTINLNNIENTIEVALKEVSQLIARELKNVLELGLSSDPLTRVALNRTIDLPTTLVGHQYEILFKVFPGTNNWILEAVDLTDSTVAKVTFESTIPWRDVTLSNKAGTGLPKISSSNFQHHIDFIRAAGSTTFAIYIW